HIADLDSGNGTIATSIEEGRRASETLARRSWPEDRYVAQHAEIDVHRAGRAQRVSDQNREHPVRRAVARWRRWESSRQRQTGQRHASWLHPGGNLVFVRG